MTKLQRVRNAVGYLLKKHPGLYRYSGFTYMGMFHVQVQKKGILGWNTIDTILLHNTPLTKPTS